MSLSNGNTASARLLIVSNRLPVTIRHVSDGLFSIERSSGGLATALSHTHAEMDSLWIGWPGGHFKVGEPRKRITRVLREEHRCVPVFLSAQAIQRYYYGFSNRALWPLFHSFQSYLVYNEEEWEAYVHANQVFCEAVLEEAQEQDLIWVQDYHLFLLPGMLRQALPDARIGFFLHTPFPLGNVSHPALPRGHCTWAPRGRLAGLPDLQLHAEFSLGGLPCPGHRCRNGVPALWGTAGRMRGAPDWY